MPTILDRRTGELFTINPLQARVSRMQYRIFRWAECVDDIIHSTTKTWMAMVTLTYRPREKWLGLQIRDFIKWVHRKLRKYLLAIAWTAELQKRGAIHYHVILVLTQGCRLPKPDKCGGWTHGMTRVEKARSPFYIAKYATKGNDNHGNAYPKHARIFATWISKQCRDVTRYANYRLSVYPKWIREIVASGNHGETARREPGGGWRIGDAVFPSPYYVVSFD